LLYTTCWLSRPYACVQVDHTSERERESIFFPVLPLPSLEKVRVVSFSLEAFWFYYLVLKFPEKNIKKYSKKKKRSKKEAKKARRQHRGGFVCVFFSFVRWWFVITLVSRLTFLAQSSLGPAYYHRSTISQLALFANVVLVLPRYLLSATYSSTYPHCTFTGILVPAPIHPLQGC
jgi:hypothetical protein